MKRLGWLLFGALALAGTSVYAVDTKESFKDLDKNHDGVISASETREDPTLSRYWYKFDANDDGALERSEFSAFEETKIDKLEPYVLRHDWYGSVGEMPLGD